MSMCRQRAVSFAAPHPERRIKNNEEIHIPFLDDNLTVIRIDPNGRNVKFIWEGFNKKNGNKLNVPYEKLQLTAGKERYEVSTRKAGNNKLFVNGKLYKFKSTKEGLLIKFGVGVSITPLIQSDPESFLGIFSEAIRINQINK